MEKGPAEERDGLPPRRQQGEFARPREKGSGFITLASIAVMVAMLYFAQSVLIPVALATLFAFLLAPFVAQAERVVRSRMAATLFVVLASLAIVGSLGYTLEQQFAQVAASLPEYRQSIHDKLAGFMRSGRVVEHVRDEIQRTVKELAAPATQPTPAAAGEAARESAPVAVRISPEPSSPLTLAISYLSTLLSPLVTAALVIVFVIFILLRREDLRERMVQLLGEGHLSTTTRALDEAAQRVSRFLICQSVINTLYGAAAAAGLLIINHTLGGDRNGMRTAFMAGILCAALRFIPYIGVWIGASLPLAIAFAVYPGNGVFFATLALFVGLEALVSQVVEPRWLGTSTGLSAIAVLAAALFWGWLWGPIGLLLSTPLTALLVVMGKYVPRMEFLGVLLGDTPTLDPPMRIYQRLIAGDDSSAGEIAAEYLKDMPLEKVFDEVLLPAIAACQRDWSQGRLSEQQHEFVRESMRDLIETLADQAALPEKGAEAAKEAGQPLPRGSDIHIACAPAQDAWDELSAGMIHRLLAPRGYRVTVLSAASLASEIMERIEAEKPDVVVICALPPHAAGHARYLVKRLACRWPDLQLIVGLWLDSAVDRHHLCESEAVCAVASLEQTIAQLGQASHAILIKTPPGPVAGGPVAAAAVAT